MLVSSLVGKRQDFLDVLRRRISRKKQKVNFPKSHIDKRGNDERIMLAFANCEEIKFFANWRNDLIRQEVEIAPGVMTTAAHLLELLNHKPEAIRVVIQPGQEGKSMVDDWVVDSYEDLGTFMLNRVNFEELATIIERDIIVYRLDNFGPVHHMTVSPKRSGE